MPTLKPYTLPSRSKSPPPEPKLINKYVFANADRQMNNKARNANKGSYVMRGEIVN
jgi:hypothetical protein